MAASDLERIKQLEKEIGIKLERRTSYEIRDAGQLFFVLDENEQVIGLNLDGIKLDDVPTALSTLSKFRHLQKLSLFNNQLKNISSLQGLSKLTELYLGGNQITGIFSLQRLRNLAKLDLMHNQITGISSLQGLSSLTHLNLWYNKITQLPLPLIELDLEIDVDSARASSDEKKIFLRNNPLEKPPLEIIRKGKRAIKAYFDSLKEDTLPLNEVKVLLVGDGAAGKTSLVKRLLGLDFNETEPQTHGIKIKPWYVEQDNKTIKAHLWDFGGQEIMHATHQFFLSKRSLYLLVLDGRKDEKTEYWLNYIESFCCDSPVLVVINKTDEHPGFELNRKFLQDKYPNIKGFYRISCKTGDGFNILVPALQKALFHVEMIHTTWAASWFAVKTELENMKEPFLSYSQYRDICARKKIMEKIHQDTLVDFLNDLGVILHFKDLELHDTYVLDPKWATEAVYKIINSKPLAEHGGVLKLDQLEEILKPAKAGDYSYPPDKYTYIIELMIKFELCYKLEGNRILIPNLLVAEECAFDFDYATSLKFIIDYDFLPPSVMPRFIVRRHKDIKDRLQWRTGVVLEDKAYHAAAVVKCDDRERRISIFVNGEQKHYFFSIIRKTLWDINDSFGKLKTTEWVPLPDNPEISVEYEELIGHERMGKTEIIIGKLGKTYPVKQLLDGIEMERDRIPGGGQVKYINYIDKGFFNPKEVYVADSKSVQFGDKAAIHGDFIFAERIRDSFNKINSAEAPDNLKGLLKNLMDDVEKMIAQLPGEKAEEIMNDLQTFMNEAISKKPRKKWWELSANGVKEAAKTVGTIGVSVLKNMDKIIPLLEKL